MSCYITHCHCCIWSTERRFFTAFVCLWADGPWVCSQRLVIAVLCAIGVLCFCLYWRAGVSPAQCLTGSSTFLHQRQWESLQKHISVNRPWVSFWLKADSLPAQGTLGLNLATPANHLWQSFEAVFWARSLCSSLKGFFKTVHFLTHFLNWC